jgi:uncharacterized membrane protein YgdD (TMEM256/DUF423 family)
MTASPNNDRDSKGWMRTIVGLAALMGAAGVALAAAAAHQGDPSRLGPASSMLLFHASATLAAALLTAQGLVQRHLGFAATASFIVGAALFSGDLVTRHYQDHALFPMAAPTGGSLLIVAWLLLALAALWPRRA